MKIITPNSITVFKDLVPYTANSSHKHFEEIKEFALQDKVDEIIEILNTKERVEEAISNSGFKLDGNAVTFLGYPLGGVLGQRILDMTSMELPLLPLEHFCKRLFNNPRKEVVEELYEFLEASYLPITEDGCFIAYKGVNKDFKDVHTNTMDNSVGQTPSMRPCDVDTDRHRTCSKGLHFAAYEYANTWAGGGNLMAVKVDPGEVVAIPSDYNNQKGRAWRYEVIEHISSREDILTDQLVYDDNTLTEEEHEELMEALEDEGGVFLCDEVPQEENFVHADDSEPYGDAYDANALDEYDHLNNDK